jgi:hypothetical protein
VQVVTLLELKRLGVALPFGRELTPLPLLEAARLFAVPLAAAVLLSLAWAAARRRGCVLGPAQRVAASASLLLAAGFAVLTVTVASRSQELAAAFGTAGAALVFTGLLSVAARPLRAGLVGLLAATLVALPLAAAPRFAASARYRGRPPAAFAPAARWLSAHARPGDLVFHLWWDQFPHLFFWNPGGRYVNGMDPVFQYAYDPALFWKTQGLADETAPGATCGLPRCGPGDLEPAARVLRRDFGARYVVLHRGVSARTDARLASDASFRRVFDDGTDVVYEILPEPRAGAPEYDPATIPSHRR